MSMMWGISPGISSPDSGNGFYNPGMGMSAMESAGNQFNPHVDPAIARMNHFGNKGYSPQPAYYGLPPTFAPVNPHPGQMMQNQGANPADMYRQFVRSRLGMGSFAPEGREPKPQPGPMAPVFNPYGPEGRENRPNPYGGSGIKPEGRVPRPRSLYDEIG